MQRLRDAIDNSPIGEIRRWLLAFEQRVLAMVDSLPLRAVADEITGTLDAVAAAVDDVDLDGLLAPVTHFGETVGAAISGLGGDAVRNTIGQVWDAVDTALNQAATVLGQLRDALDAVTGPLGEFTTRVGPAVTAITDLITEVRVVVDAFDLDPAGRRGRSTPSTAPATSSRRSTCRCCPPTPCASSATPPTHWPTSTSRPPSTVPSPRCSTRSTPGRRCTPPSDVLADVADPARRHRPDATDRHARQRRSARCSTGSPTLDPAQLQRLIDDAVAPVREAIGVLDATAVLAPATQSFAELMSRLDGLLDPEPIFAPLQQAYQPVLDVVAALDPAALLELVGAAHRRRQRGVRWCGGRRHGRAGHGHVREAAGLTALPSTVDASTICSGSVPAICSSR